MLKRIGAVMLSLVLAVSTVFTTTAVSEKKVSAQAEIKNKKQLQKWALATKLLPDGKEAGFSYNIRIIDNEKSKTPIEFTDRTLDGNSFNLNLESEDTSIVDTDYDRVTAKYKKGTTNIKYNLKSAESGNVIYSGSIPSTVYSISIGAENYYGIYLLPGESRQVTANIEGYDGPVSYQWTSAECKIDNQLGNTCKITAPSKEGNPKIFIQAFIKEGESEEPIGVKEEEITVADCKLSFSYRKFVGDHSEAASGDTLKVGEAYWFTLGGASFAWDYGNGNRDDSKRQTYKV